MNLSDAKGLVKGHEEELKRGKSTMQECPSCALPVDSKVSVCPYCGYEFPAASPFRQALAWLMVLLVLASALYALLG